LSLSYLPAKENVAEKTQSVPVSAINALLSLAKNRHYISNQSLDMSITICSFRSTKSGIMQLTVVAGGFGMPRDRLLKVVLGLAGALFVALTYPMVMFVQREPAAAMMFTVYVTLSVFLLLSIRNPAALADP
jgi:hypothetical protein